MIFESGLNINENFALVMGIVFLLLTVVIGLAMSRPKLAGLTVMTYFVQVMLGLLAFAVLYIVGLAY